MFRCPCCGQAQQLPTAVDPVSAESTQFLLNADQGKTGFGLHATYLARKDDEADIWQLVTDDMIPAIIAQLPTETVCPLCKESSSTDFWFKCWDDPLQSHKLETENLCHCGGELYLEEIPKSQPKRFGWVCEKCQWVKPTGMLSGSGSTMV